MSEGCLKHEPANASLYVGEEAGNEVFGLDAGGGEK